MDHPDPAYVTVVAFPDGMSANRAVEVVANACGTDEPTIRHRLARPPPLIAAMLTVVSPAFALDTLLSHGCDAFTFALSDLAAFGATLKVRDLRISEAGIEVDVWRGPTTVVRREDIRLLVRARLSREDKSRPMPVERSLPSPGPHTTGLAPDAPRGQMRSSEKLDIHTADGRVFQVDSKRFAFGVLGDLRARGDRANMDRLCELLAHVSPDEVVDDFFPLWHPPPGYRRLRLPGMRVHNDDPSFAFYSRWARLLYRHLRG